MISPDTFVLKNGGCINGFEFDVFESDGSNLAEPETCPSCGRFVDLLTLTEPISGNLVAEKSLYDLGAHLGGEIVFSAKARKEFDKHQVTGIKNVQKLGILVVEGPFQIHELDEYFLAQVSYGASRLLKKAYFARSAHEESTTCEPDSPNFGTFSAAC